MNIPRLSPDRSLCYWLTLLGGLLAGLAVGVYAANFVVAKNFHEVVPGKVFRSAQLSAGELERIAKQHGIRTIVNLRGSCFDMDWYKNESRAAHDSDLALEDIALSAGRLPPTSELRYLVGVLDRSEYPLLIHCKQGADRTGLVSALIMLLYTDADLATARGQLGVRYGHVSLGRTAYMGRFFDLYENWLVANGTLHSPERFRQWLERGYTAGPAAATLELLDAPAFPPGKPWAVRVRATNRSTETWHFQPGTTAGVHCGYFVTDEQGQLIVRDRAGLLRADVPPGGSIDLTLAMPALPGPGPYTLQVDMLEETQQSYFYQHGSQPIVCQIVSRPQTVTTDRETERNR